MTRLLSTTFGAELPALRQERCAGAGTAPDNGRTRAGCPPDGNSPSCLPTVRLHDTAVESAWRREFAQGLKESLRTRRGGASMPGEPYSISAGDHTDDGGRVSWRSGSDFPRNPRRSGAPAWGGGDLARRTAVADLAEGIAHDLKNQLTVVAASVQLARELPAGDRQDLLDRAWRSAMRAARLMDDMLRYTRGIGTADGDADACEALETAVAGAWGHCCGRGVHLEMRLEPGLPRVAGSTSALRVLLLHMLRWSADQCPPDCRLVAAAQAGPGGISVQFRPATADGQALAFPGSERGVPGDLAALVVQTGAAVRVDASGPSVWLASSGHAAAQPGSD